MDEIEGRSLRETLTAFGQHLMNIYMSPTVIGVYRIAVTEAIRFPDLVRSFYEQGPGRAASQLAEVLELAKNRAVLEASGRQADQRDEPRPDPEPINQS